jgi:hypothetical protein
MSEFLDHVNPNELTPGERATMDQRWARANEGLDMLIMQLRDHYVTCQSGPPCVSTEVAHSFGLLLNAGPAETMSVLHAALHRLANQTATASPEVAKQEASDRPCPSQPEPKEPE